MSEPLESASSGSPSWSTLIHAVFAGLLVVGGLAYWMLKPPTLNPMSDPLAAEAMALVQTHRAEHAPTIRQAVTDRVKTLADRGQGVRLGEWTVERESEGTYLVRVWIREKITKGWFEREYLWKVNAAKRMIIPLTVAASDLMPIKRGEEKPLGFPSRFSLDPRVTVPGPRPG
ncbi:MAG: hypothetical protein ACREJU_04815 [Nitrospiraceae bacterium]